MNFDVDTTNNKYQDMVGKAEDLLNKLAEMSSFVIPALLKLDYSFVEQLYKDEPELKKYKFNLENIYRYKEHTLDENTEEILTSLSKCFSNSESTYELLTDTDMTFGTIKDEYGNEIELNESNYSIFTESKNREVRKKAFETLLSKYSDFKNTIAATFSGNIETSIKLSKIKNYNSALEASLYSDNVKKEVYDNLINTVSKGLPSLYKYYKFKKKILNLDELHLYDIHVSLIDDIDEKYDFDTAKEIVLKALSVLGTDYSSNLNKAFDEHWIDIYHNRGKRGGAYSSGFYDINPYVLLNYEGSINDVLALAHELGHSMHTYYSCKYNEYQNSGYEIFIAEVASTVNELLLANYMLENSKDNKEKLNILNHLIELYKANIYRQTMFAEFEKKMYEERESGTILTNEFISNEYYKINKKYFGNDVYIDDLIKYEWERISHFYYDFYVYKYATGFSAATYIVDNIMKDDSYLEKYLNFLKSGGSNYSLEQLKIADVDLTDPKVIESAIMKFEELESNFENICNQNK